CIGNPPVSGAIAKKHDLDPPGAKRRIVGAPQNSKTAGSRNRRCRSKNRHATSGGVPRPKCPLCGGLASCILQLGSTLPRHCRRETRAVRRRIGGLGGAFQRRRRSSGRPASGSQLAIAVPNCYVSASIFGRTTGPLRLALPGARFRLSPNSTNRERATKPCARSHVHTVSERI